MTNSELMAELSKYDPAGPAVLRAGGVTYQVSKVIPAGSGGVMVVGTTAVVNP